VLAIKSKEIIIKSEEKEIIGKHVAGDCPCGETCSNYAIPTRKQFTVKVTLQNELLVDYDSEKKEVFSCDIIDDSVKGYIINNVGLTDEKEINQMRKAT